MEKEGEDEQEKEIGEITSSTENQVFFWVYFSGNELLNPRQIEYPAHLGFNDLHIEAIRHIDPNATQAANQSE